MIFKVLIFLLIMQFVLFIFGLVCNNNIKNRKPKLAKFLRILYIADSFLVIAYVIFFIINIFNQSSKYFNYCNIKSNYYMLSVLILVCNIIKLIFFLIKKKRKKEKNNNGMFFQIYLFLCLSIALSTLSIFKETAVYIPDGNKRLIETTYLNKIELVEKNKRTKQYELLFFDSNNNAIELEKFNIEAFYGVDRYIEKYEIKQVVQDCFGNESTNTIYEYKIYTPDKT